MEFVLVFLEYGADLDRNTALGIALAFGHRAVASALEMDCTHHA